MPDYLAPGVSVEETSFRSKSITGVSTGTTAFAGVARRGGAAPVLLTSFAEFERAYGGLSDLAVDPGVNYLAHAARAFFGEGGRRLYITRVIATSATAAATAALMPGGLCRFHASGPGEAGNGRISLSVLATPLARGAWAGTPEGSLVRINRRKPEYALKRGKAWRDAAVPSRPKRLAAVTTPMDLLMLNVTATDKDGFTQACTGLGFTAGHPRYVGDVLSRAAQAGGIDAPWFCLESGSDVTALDVLKLATPGPGQAVKEFALGIGAGAQAGTDAVPSLDDWKAALARLVSIEDIALVAAPGHTEFPATAEAVTAELVAHASAPGAYRFAVLEVPKGRLVAEALAFKARVDSRFAALYYPWVVVAGPGAAEVVLPPSGFMCGIYTRVDAERGVQPAPTNEVVRGALRFERTVSKGEQDALNPAGVNCLRFFVGRGHLVWGARTTSSDAEWKYVSVRRYFTYLEHSIDQGTQWAMFEPNGEALWNLVQRVIEDFLLHEWRSGALPGNKPEQAFFVKCDRTTMTQNDLDQGRLICLIGVAVVKPAEFVLFRIGRWTADRRD